MDLGAGGASDSCLLPRRLFRLGGFLNFVPFCELSFLLSYFGVSGLGQGATRGFWREACCDCGSWSPGHWRCGEAACRVGDLVDCCLAPTCIGAVWWTSGFSLELIDLVDS